MPPEALSPDALFGLTGPLTLLGWAALCAYPLAPRAITALALAIPAMLSLLYAALVLSFWAGATGGFGSLAQVMALFDQPEIALAGWVHYLAFDMLVGLWIVRTARDRGIPHLIVLPCLPLTFLFGPAGFLAFLILATALPKRTSA
ncbi:MAG TPA: ABA4-like family protein [Paracoccaceae bacterium]|nr:ABA4-like family protein [Paracoccaceae bacterium]